MTCKLGSAVLTDCILSASLQRPPALRPMQSCGCDAAASAQQHWAAVYAQHASAVLPRRFYRWHLETQDRLLRHLRVIWSDDSPRVMVDLGCHAGHGNFRNRSDALLWLDHFGQSAKGGTVLAVDAVADYVLDHQHRFELEPYASMRAISKSTATLAIGDQDNVSISMARAARDMNECCQGRGICGHTWTRLERAGVIDHLCRIPRQRASLGGPRIIARRNAELRLPPTEQPLTLSAAEYEVRSSRVDTLWAERLGRQHISFLKIDIDKSCETMKASTGRPHPSRCYTYACT